MPILESLYLENLPDFLVSERIKNPFKDRILHAQFDACIKCFDERHKDLIATDWRDGRFYQHRGNSFATHFWWGYNGIHDRFHYLGSYDTPAYACWVAGKAVKKALDI